MMKYRFLIYILLVCVILQAEQALIQEKRYTIEISNLDDKNPIILYFNQECNVEIENEQTTACNHPIKAAVSPAEHQSASVQSIMHLFSFSNLLTPLKLSFIACACACFYLIKTKLTLYNLSKACVEKAFWSLWKLRSTSHIDNQDMQALLYEMLKRYQTDQYTLAIAHFLRDIDMEAEMLHQYIDQSQQSCSAIVMLIFPDIQQDIIQVQTRIAHLALLKQKALDILAHGVP